MANTRQVKRQNIDHAAAAGVRGKASWETADPGMQEAARMPAARSLALGITVERTYMPRDIFRQEEMGNYKTLLRGHSAQTFW